MLGFGFIFVSGFALLPAMIVAAITEAFSIRGALSYAVGGAVIGLACYLGLVPFDTETLRFEGIVRRHLEIMTGAGIVGGFVYWMSRAAMPAPGGATAAVAVTAAAAGAFAAAASAAVILRALLRASKDGRARHPSRLARLAPRSTISSILFLPVSSAKPRAMNRTGLFIALALAVVIGLLFGIYPELDLKLAALFYDPATRSFPLKFNTLAVIARDAAMWISWGLALPAIIALVAKLVRPERPLLMSGRAMVFLLVTLALSAGVLTNFTFKSFWGRPRPVMVTQFNGPQEFVPWWDPRGACGRNCSFFSGEGATAFWAYAPAALTPPPWRPLAYAAATLFGVTTSVLRMAFGGHFFTDVATAGLVTFLVIWLAYRTIYRWPRTRLTDEGIDAALTRLGTRFRRRRSNPAPVVRPPSAIKRVPIAAKFVIRAPKKHQQ